MGAATACGLLGGSTRPARAQVGAQQPGGPCNLYFDDTTTTHSHSVKLPSGKYNTFAGKRVIAHCTNQSGVRLKADSAEYYDEQGLLYLIGHVHYTDPRAVIDAHHMTYYVADEHLIADTNVVAVMPSGTTMHGPHADYYRMIPNIRPRAQLTAPGRPHFHLVQRDSANPTQVDTAGVDANTVFMDGDSLVYASRKVVIKRTDLNSTSDSAFMNQGTGFARLMIHPVIHGTQEQHPFTLKGDVVDLYTVNHQLVRVVSIRHADAVSKDMHLTSDTLDLRFTDKVLSRSYAWGPGRAHATTPDRDILADSIDVLMPGQIVHQIRSVRKAFATGEPDTTHFRSKERDWMKGDTIFAYFDTSQIRRRDTANALSPPATTAPAVASERSSAQGDGTRAAAPNAAAPAADTQPELRTMVASGDAHAFYQLPPKDKTMKRPALDYTRGRVITIHLLNKQVQTIIVVDSAAGVYLEPQADTINKDSARRARALTDTLPHVKRPRGAKAKSDTTKPHPDTAHAASDTTHAPPDTAHAPADSTHAPPDTAAGQAAQPGSAPADSAPADSAPSAPKGPPKGGALSAAPPAAGGHPPPNSASSGLMGVAKPDGAVPTLATWRASSGSSGSASLKASLGMHGEAVA